MKKTKFKQTEIGKIPEDWKVKSIAEVAEVIGGGTPSTKKPEYWNGKIAWLTPKDLSGYKFRYIEKGERNISEEGLKNSSAKLLPKHTVLLTSRAPVGYVAIASKELCTNQGFRSLIPKPNESDHEFLYYLLKLKANFLKSQAFGSTFGELSGSTLKSLKFAFPPLSEQKAIARILSSLDDKIELNHHMNRTLEAIAQAIFKHWFIDFEFLNEEGKPYKSSGGEMVYNEELGKEIPKGWEVKPLDKIAYFLNGLALQKYPPENEEDYLPVIKIRELRQGITESSDKASSNIPKEYIVHDGDVLFSWSGSLEVKIWCGGKGALNQHLFKVTSEEYPKWFYYFWIKKHLPFFRRIAEDKATTMGHIKRHHLSESLVVVPERKLMEKGNDVLNPLIENFVINSVENRKLTKIRDALLPKLMSGEIRVVVDKMEGQT